jgi:hypothetical protein
MVPGDRHFDEPTVAGRFVDRENRPSLARDIA